MYISCPSADHSATAYSSREGLSSVKNGKNNHDQYSVTDFSCLWNKDDAIFTSYWLSLKKHNSFVNMKKIRHLVHWLTSIESPMKVYPTPLNAKPSARNVTRKMKILPRSAIDEMNKCMNGSRRNAVRIFQFQVHFDKRELGRSPV